MSIYCKLKYVAYYVLSGEFLGIVKLEYTVLRPQLFGSSTTASTSHCAVSFLHPGLSSSEFKTLAWDDLGGSTCLQN